MKTLRQYLDGTACEKQLKDLIELIAYQSIPIRDAFIDNQSYAGTENTYGKNRQPLTNGQTPTSSLSWENPVL